MIIYEYNMQINFYHNFGLIYLSDKYFIMSVGNSGLDSLSIKFYIFLYSKVHIKRECIHSFRTIENKMSLILMMYFKDYIFFKLT